MTLKKSLALLALSSSLVYVSCSADAVEPTTSSSASTTPATNKCDYSPYSVGSTFTSEVAVKNIFDGKWSYSESKTSVTGLKDIGGKKWSTGMGIFSGDTTSQVQSKEGYVRCDGAGTYALLKGVGANGADLELNYLQYPLTKNKTWKSNPVSISQQGITQKFYYQYTVLNTGLTKKIKNTTFKDVVEIEEKLIVSVTYNGDTDISETVLKRFFDKTAGHIQTISFFENPFTGDVDTALVQSLVSYNIK